MIETIYILTLCFLPFFAFLFYLKKESDKTREDEQIDTILSDILVSTKAIRVFISEIHHSGNIAEIGSDIYFKIVYSTEKEDVHINIYKAFKHHKIDVFLQKTWADVESRQQVVLETDTLQDGVTKDFYKTNKIKTSRLYYLGRHKNKMYQCSIHIGYDNIVDEKIIELTAKSGVLALQEIFKNR